MTNLHRPHAVGVDLDDVGTTLEDRGVASFAGAFADVVDLLGNRMSGAVTPAGRPGG